MMFDPSIDENAPDFDWAMLPAALIVIGLMAMAWIYVFGLPDWIATLTT